MNEIPKGNDKVEEPKDAAKDTTALSGADLLHQDYLERKQAKSQAPAGEAVEDAGKTASKAGDVGAKMGEIAAKNLKDAAADNTKPFNEAEFAKVVEKMTPSERAEALRENEKNIAAFKAGMTDTLNRLEKADPENAKAYEQVKEALQKDGVIKSWAEVAKQQH